MRILWAHERCHDLEHRGIAICRMAFGALLTFKMVSCKHNKWTSRQSDRGDDEYGKGNMPFGLRQLLPG